MSYQINLTNGQPLVVIADRTIDTSTSLSLVGRGTVVFGNPTAENFVYLLENFSNTTPPAHPLVGQLWFDSQHGILMFYSAGTWHPVATDGAFGDTVSLVQGPLLNGAASTSTRYAGSVGIILNNGLQSTTAAAILSEGIVVALSSAYEIPFASLPTAVTIAGEPIAISSCFPNGLVPGINLSQAAPYSYAGSSQFSDAASASPFLLSADDTGGVNAINVNIQTPIVSNGGSTYPEYLTVKAKIAQTNTAATTINVNELGPVRVTKRDGSDLTGGNVVQGRIYTFVSDGQKFVIQTPLASDDYLVSLIPTLITEVGTNLSSITSLNNSVSTISSTVQTISSQYASNASAVTQEATTRQTATDGLSALITTLSSRTDDLSSMITVESTARTTSYNSLAQQITTLTAQNSNAGVIAQITAESTARAAADQAMAQQITTFTTNLGAAQSTLTSTQNAQATNIAAQAQSIVTLQSNYGTTAAGLANEAITRAAQDTALSQSIATLTATVGTNAATATTQVQTQATALTALSQTVSTLSSTVGGQTATLATLAASINGTTIQYGVTGTINGSTGGFELTGVANSVGATFNLDIASNVTIHGNVIVDGSITTSKLKNASVLASNATEYVPYSVPTLLSSWQTVANTMGSSTFVNGLFTCGSGDAGLFIISSMLVYNVAATDITLVIVKNGSIPLTYNESTTPGQNNVRGVSATAGVILAAGDTIQAQAYQSNTFGYSHNLQYSYLSIMRTSS